RLRGIEIIRLLRAGAGKIDRGLAAYMVDTYGDADAGAVVEGILEISVAQCAERAPHELLALVEDMSHVGTHHIATKMLHGKGKFVGAPLAGRALRAQVGQVLLDVSRRIAAAAQQRAHFGLEESAFTNQQDAVDQNSFF